MTIMLGRIRQTRRDTPMITVATATHETAMLLKY